MSVAEGRALPHEVVGEVDCRRLGPLGGRAHAVGVEGGRGQESPERGQGQAHLVDRVEERLLVLLQVAVVRERETLEGGEDGREMTDEAARLSPRQLGHVGVLLLRQHRGAGGVGVRQVEEPELLGRPQHDLFADATEVHAEQGEVEQRLRDEVAVAHRVDGVLEPTGKTQVGRHTIGV